jgi:hypothetical protein
MLQTLNSIICYFLLANASIAAEPSTTQKVLERVNPALFLVLSNDGGTGSGFLYGDQKTIITNKHVLSNMQLNSIVQMRSIQLNGNGFEDLGDTFSGVLTYKHPDLDIAVISLDTILLAEPIKPIDSPSKQFLPRGTQIFAHGFPSLLSPMISSGLISGHYQDPLSKNIYYLTDASLASGSSGGPVTDIEGKLVGIATAVHVNENEFGFNWGYVIPVHIMEREISFKHQSSMHLDIDAFITDISAETIYVSRLDKIISAYDSVAKQSGSMQELAENTIEFFQKTKKNAKAFSLWNAKNLLQTITRLKRIYFERFFILVLKNQFDVNESIFDLVGEVDDEFISWGGSAFDSLAEILDVSETAAFLDYFIDHHKELARKQVAILQRNCSLFSEIDYQNGTWYRDLKQEDIISTATSGAAMFQCYMAFSFVDNFLETVEDVPVSTKEKLRSLELTLMRLGDEQADCLNWVSSLLGYDSFAQGPNYDELYTAFVDSRIQEGYSSYASDTGEMEKEGVRTFPIPASDSTRELAVLAVGYGVDVDLYLYESPIEDVEKPLMADEMVDSAPELSFVMQPGIDYILVLVNTEDDTPAAFKIVMLVQDR